MAERSGGESPQPEPSSAPVQRYRFRVRGPDGRELTSGIAELKLPAPLVQPQWSKAALAAGETAQLSVSAPGRDGETVLFHVEMQRGSAWEPLTHASGQVKDGLCKVELPMPSLPGEPNAAAGAQHKVRFRAVAQDSSEAVSEEAQLAPSAGGAGRLVSAAFGHARYREGESASLMVEGSGLEGADLRLIMERKDVADFVPLGEARATVKDGMARAQLPLTRGPTRKDGAPPPRLRFRALCMAGELTSAEVELDPPVAEKLLNPEWGGAVPGRGAAFGHGEVALMRVQAPGLDGRSVRFRVEQLRAGKWEAYAVATALVKQGIACAELHALHPEHGKRSAQQLPLRFRPELLSLEPG